MGAVFHLAFDFGVDTSLIEAALRSVLAGNPVFAFVEFKYERKDGMRQIFELRIFQSGLCHSGVHPSLYALLGTCLSNLPGNPMIRQSSGR